MKTGNQSVTAVTDPVCINFAGFVPLSTVDWRGRSVCVIFFRGCPVRCWYCQNPGIQSGTDIKDCMEILSMIRSAELLISGVVFSGGEATMQPDALRFLAEHVKRMGLVTGLHTNGVFPEVLADLISKRLIDLVALDIKPDWNLNTVKGKERALGDEVKRSLALCSSGYREGSLPKFEVVLTLFPGSSEQVASVVPDVALDVDLVLQQGEYTGIRALQFEDLTAIADELHRPVRIRTREQGEIWYEGNRNCRNAGIREG
ncbi:anaerobic ribonucleoside-triphosphate reductase activating protein [Methanospirillum lacunae]|uniref:Anaerobic ribonucleoside-triphosphate reductase activating protein n=1 Tax=Methanospirillum lacunae TaxID=668570 RepID=A0A2V2MWG1_9EURY|nr:anaerobic ribonucleoside-triphosphate reductase activating protein [Methanospirillum lacunae]PWR71729.1 anaerobic ribonucleoside-triphosphate reductase activating protein [Methanospirillum lacunae]